jgi:hypothetical protein
MNSLGHLSSRFLQAAAIVGAFTWAASALLAYHQTLDESDIMSAYQLGHEAQFGQFIAAYQVAFPPRHGIQVSRIAIRTPFANLLQRRHDHRGGPSEIDFRDDYLAHPDTSFTAILTVDTKVPKPPSGLDDPNSPFWKSFKFELSQDDPIPPRSRSAFTLVITNYDNYTSTYTDSVMGGELYLQYDVQDIPSKTTHLKATAPDGTTLTADFDLDTLR